MDQCSCWSSTRIYSRSIIFYLSDNLTRNAKFFNDDTSLFSVVYDVNTSAKELNDDLKKVNDQAFQWKMSFNPDPSKQAQQVNFSRKSKRLTHPPLVFNSNNASQTFSLKRLGVTWDFKLAFEEHLNNILAKVNKAIGLLRKLRNILPRTTLIIIYKAFIRPHLDYRHVLYDQAFNNLFKEKLESIQYNACLASTGAIWVRQKKKSIKNWDRSPFEIDAGAESFIFFIRSWKMKILNIYSA